MDAGTNLAHHIASRMEWWAVDRVVVSHFDSAASFSGGIEQIHR
jgi:hypothetical protein